MKQYFTCLNYFSTDFKWISYAWNFTSAGHGKSSADAVGGYIKEMCNRAVACGGDALNAQDICNLLQSKNNETITIITENDIKEIKYLLLKNLKPVKATMSIHHVVWLQSKPKNRHVLIVLSFPNVSIIQLHRQ